MPVLVFTRVSGNRCQLANVGEGPAIGVILGDRLHEGKWESKVSCRPIAAGGEVDVDWIQHGYEVVAVYRDIRGNIYSTVCTLSENRFYESNKFPDLVPTVEAVMLNERRKTQRRN